ncbi:hypothetical protein DO021_02295 [Desulfobacter hydrogenophilus]|uniref:P-type ATPase A domain-containing protein n=1 Tax=Desulfobacter hydrogenophilus TaxID=2291 RepID=A0A328FJC4_9BACT|nr:hypothetical protein [Desulfobacter hydrogenophilus]NDY70616.1 hypothetical protein [Desulfobacter hydrogenophilus]QBH13985.1 hypothetical protein EYB58_14255 [Desulfobacter hydrogenophilus]RAM03602.1 hypothetical protein DO021_02295 [Desulfobacter hydrogenophilus]
MHLADIDCPDQESHCIASGYGCRVSFILGQFLEGIAILVALIINVVIGFGTELRAARSMEALQQMTRRHAKMLRQSKIQKIDAAKLVPIDILVLEGGDMVPADRGQLD